MNRYERKVIQAQVDLLWQLRTIYENELTPNQVYWIDDDITYIEVKYLNAENDSTTADELRQEEPNSIAFLAALKLLSVRIENTVSYFGLKGIA